VRIDRLDATGLGLSLGVHGAIVAILALGFFAATKPPLAVPPAIEVEIVSDDVGMTSAVPEPAPLPPAPRVAPEQGPPEEAAPPVPVQAAPAPPKPVAAPVPRPSTVAVPQRPAVTRPAPATPTDARQRRRPGLDRSLVAGLRDSPGAPTRTPSPATTTSAAPAPIGPAQLAGLAAAIRRQVQPCADRIVSPGPGAERITTKLNLQMRENGSFAVPPRVVSQVTDADNARYGARVGELARAAFVQCAPFELPPALYDGWKNINLNYKLPE
jgi:outer membrane biosynthesis protein TonB